MARNKLDSDEYVNSKTMLIHANWLQPINLLPKDKQLRFINMMLGYGCFGIEPSQEDQEINLPFWHMIKMEIDNDKAKRQEMVMNHRAAQKRYAMKRSQAEEEEI